YASGHADQQRQLTTLANCIASVPEETNKESPKVDGLHQNAKGNRLLHVLRSWSEDFNGMSNQSPQRTAEDNRGHQSLPPSPSQDTTTLPALYITCFGHFEVNRLGKP